MARPDLLMWRPVSNPLNKYYYWQSWGSIILPQPPPSPFSFIKAFRRLEEVVGQLFQMVQRGYASSWSGFSRAIQIEHKRLFALFLLRVLVWCGELFEAFDWIYIWMTNGIKKANGDHSWIGAAAAAAGITINMQPRSIASITYGLDWPCLLNISSWQFGCKGFGEKVWIYLDNHHSFWYDLDGMVLSFLHSWD